MTDINECLKCKNCSCKKPENNKCIKCNKGERMKERKICYDCKKIWLKQYYIDKLKEKHPNKIGRPKIEKEPKEKKARGRPKKEKIIIVKKRTHKNIDLIDNNINLSDEDK